MSKLHTLEVKSTGREQFIDLTTEIGILINKSNISEGFCQIYAPHTTAGITINEGHDPSVVNDILMQLNKLVPHSGGYTHQEGNSDAHIKAFLAGAGKTVLVTGGKLLLGTWQRIFFCEFDGPRRRKVFIKITGDLP
ncbi:secondary thiamine-phosphate synthase enzyme YjbQ [Desulfoscipio gibsoniae]|uniref:Secondary thiamine-phosphate synthase enzyme n=1 Tax=Desulfoscipio gibsoniae DSM 7213 TaxID=767817 RepID=R4KPF3_9FIRM|nr:secondary thiamine-phosphate synthase enzyme YjbQ [Desulfoscipio gibsoniae]AGL01501.1 secondary thiamine-phosphate synthase enzyme [Desulfoscipio gibsoniae DSM 7213]